MVLDTISAVSLVSSIVQFVEFGSKLVSESHGIYRSVAGASAENVELEMIAESLHQLCRKLATPAPVRHHIATSQKDDDRLLEKLAKSCKDVANELLSIIQQLKLQDGRPRKWGSFHQALKSLWKKDRIDALQKRMESLRSQLILQLQVTLSEQQTAILSFLNKSKEDESRMIMNACSQRDIRHIEALDQLLASIRHTLIDNRQPLESIVTHADLNRVCLQVSKSMQPAIDIVAKEEILNSLRYPNMSDRQSSIANAHEATFEWILRTCEKDPDDPRSRVWFYDWLQTDKQIYWISGKPGSGKSTLMKYLYRHQKTHDALQRWAGSSTLIMAKFYFWNAGTALQKSLQGLFQSLIYEIFLQCPELLFPACSTRWPTSTGNFRFNSPWDLDELMITFKILIKQVSKMTTVKFCFFIDGLDEFDGDVHDVIEVFDCIHHSPNIKICLSSRPWNAFEEAFGDPRLKLYLQDLTREDIRLYVFSKLERSLSHNLLQEIVERAQGVFLWVFLVVRSVKEGLTNGDSIQTLEARIHNFPSDLYDFFNHMFLSVDKIYRRQSATLFRVALHTPSTLALALYSFVMEDDPNFAINVDNRILTEGETYHRHCIAKKRLFARCQGLLEIQGSLPDANDDLDLDYGTIQVGFLHRTVRDYLVTKDTQDMLTGLLDSDFHPNIPLCRALLASIKTDSRCRDLSKRVSEILWRAREVEMEGKASDKMMLDELDNAIIKRLERVVQLYSRRHFRGDYANPLREAGWEGEYPSTAFLKLVIQEGLNEYLSYRLDKDKHIIASQGDDLLSYALDALIWESLDYPDIRIETVRLLLRMGVKWTANKAWAHVFQYEFDLFQSDDAQYWHQLVEAFLKVGADPNIRSYGEPLWGEYLVNIRRFPGSVELKLGTLNKLLGHGAGPNQPYRTAETSSTVWEFFLSSLDKSQNRYHQFEAEAAKLLLQYGANARLNLLFRFFETRFAGVHATSLLTVLQEEIEYTEAGDRHFYRPSCGTKRQRHQQRDSKSPLKRTRSGIAYGKNTLCAHQQGFERLAQR